MFMLQSFLYILGYACNGTKRERKEEKNLYETKASGAFIDGLEKTRA